MLASTSFLGIMCSMCIHSITSFTILLLNEVDNANVTCHMCKCPKSLAAISAYFFVHCELCAFILTLVELIVPRAFFRSSPFHTNHMNSVIELCIRPVSVYCYQFSPAFSNLCTVSSVFSLSFRARSFDLPSSSHWHTHLASSYQVIICSWCASTY